MQLLRNADFNTLGKIMPRAKSIALSIGAVYLVLTLACALGYFWAGMSGLRRHRARHVHGRHRRHGQPRQLLRQLQPVRAVRRHRLHAARRACRSSASSSSPAASRGRSGATARSAPSCRSTLAFALGLILARVAERRRDRRAGGPRGAVQPRLDHHHHRLHLHRLLALGAHGRGDLLLRHDDLRLLGLHGGRAQGLPLPAPRSGRSPARSGGCTARTRSSPRTSRARSYPTT